MRVLILLCLPLCLTACGTERIVEKPVVHEVIKTEWRSIPGDLTTECVKATINSDMTYGEALSAWAQDRASLDVCNGKLNGIKRLTDQP